MATEIETLQYIPLFRKLTADQLQTVIAAGRRREYQDGNFLFMEGDPARTIFVILSGQVKILQITPDGQQVILRYAAPGEAVGVAAVLSGITYPASAQVMGNCRVLCWDHPTMERLMEPIPVLAVNALRIVVSRVQEFQNRVRELATERVERRLARALLRLAGQVGKAEQDGIFIQMSLSRQELAEMTGTTLYTVSRILTQWEGRGLISSGRERIKLLQPDQIDAIAEDLPGMEKSPASKTTSEI